MADTDDNRMKLLEAHKTIILPEDIDHEAYTFIIEAAIMYPNDSIRLYCNGNGGYVRDAIAIVGIIKNHGNFIGMLSGAACSAHSIIWTSCQQRFVYPFSMLGIHKTLFFCSYDHTNVDDYKQAVIEAKAMDKYQIALLVSMSNRKKKYWKRILSSVSGSFVYWIFADDIVHKYQMANFVKEMVDIEHSRNKEQDKE